MSPRSHVADDQQPEQLVQDQAEAKEALPPDVLSLMSVLRPGDAQPLARILATYPQYREEILSKAATLLGNETVSAAVHAGHVSGLQVPATPSADQGTPDPNAIASGMQQVQEEKKEATPPEAQGPQDAVKAYANDVKNDRQDAVNATATPQLYRAPDPTSWEDTVKLQVAAAENAKDLSAILRMHPALRPQIVEEARRYLSDEEIARAVRMADAAAGGIDANQEQQAPPKAAPEEPQPGDRPPGLTAPDPAAEAAWIGQARAYNAAHEDLVGEFNILTSFSCLSAGRENGAVADPIKVAAWQKDHGLEPDGKIGTHTVAAAREFNKRAKGPAPSPVDDDILNNLE
jgi:hypothetical protein